MSSRKDALTSMADIYQKRQVAFTEVNLSIARSAIPEYRDIAFPKDWREALVSAEPDKFMLPRQSDLRYNWVVVRLAAIDEAEMRDLVLDAWAMVVPKRVAAEYAERT